MQSLTPGLKEEAVIWKEPESDMPTDLGESPGAAGDNGSSPRARAVAAVISGSSVHHLEAGGAAQGHWNPPSRPLASL